jgi:hypothetical protein
VCCLVYFFIIFFFFTFSFKDDVLSSSFEFLCMLLCFWHTLSSPRSFKTLGLELHGQSHSPAAVANDIAAGGEETTSSNLCLFPKLWGCAGKTIARRTRRRKEDLLRNAAIHHFCLEAFQRFERNLVFS